MQYYTYVYAYFNCPPVVKENEQKKARLECHLCSQFCGEGARARADLYFSIFPRELESRSSLEK